MDPIIKKAEEVRNQKHRLKPSLRLRTQTEIIKFIHEEGLVSSLGGNELPSLISAVLGRLWKPSAKGFAAWTEWWSLKIDGQRISSVAGKLERRDDILATRIFRRSKTLVSNKLWPILEPIVQRRRELASKGRIFSVLERRILETVESEKSIRTDYLRRALKLDDPGNNSKFHRALTELEVSALIIGAEDPKPERHLHANIWQSWKRRTGTNSKGNASLTYEDAVLRLLERAVEASVIVRKSEIGKWFPMIECNGDLEKRLMASEKIRETDSHLVARSAIEHQSH